MTTLFLFRHGETDWNAEQRFQGHIDVPLNSTGRAQARNLIPFLRENSIEAILSSDLRRAVETAEIIAAELQVPVIQDPGLREAHLGLAQGLTVEEIQAKFGIELVSRWRSSKVTDADVSYPGGETGTAILERVFHALTRFLESNSHSRIGIASHGGVIRRVMHRLLPPHSAHVPIPNGVVYQLHYDSVRKQFSVPAQTHKGR
jgi:broad specificity phosphatase PhoE